MDDTVTYRTATLDDAPSLCELGQLLNQVHHAARPDIYAPATDDFSRDLEHWRGSLDKPERVVYIASIGDQDVAFITASLSTSTASIVQPQKVARIGSVCVAEAFWGKGIGRQLMERVKAWAVENQAQDFRLAVWPFNERAMRMYAEFGFETRAVEMGMRL